MAPPTPRAGAGAGGSAGARKGAHVPMRHPNAAHRPPQAPPPATSKSAWKFVDRAAEEIENLIESLIGMCTVNGQPRIDALDKMLEVLNEKPPHGPRACVSLIALKGLGMMVSVLGASCAESRYRASKVLQEAVAYGHGDKVHACRSWLFQVCRNLEHDDPETRASGAAVPVCCICLSCMSALHVCLISVPYVSALYVYLICINDMSALYGGVDADKCLSASPPPTPPPHHLLRSHQLLINRPPPSPPPPARPPRLHFYIRGRKRCVEVHTTWWREGDRKREREREREREKERERVCVCVLLL
jgi:hypothetical protein